MTADLKYQIRGHATRRLGLWTAKLSPDVAAAVGLAAIAAVALLDYATGYEVSFPIFYLVPIAIGSWCAGRRIGLLLSIAAALSWLATSYTAEQQYQMGLIPVWSAVVHFGFFWTAAYLLSSLRFHLERESELARSDGLTGVLNSRSFKETSDVLFDLAGRHGHATTLGYVDIDNFKALNDSRGHAEGDRALQEVAAVMMGSVRSTDVLGRLGGDEFAIVLPETDMEAARGVFSQIHARLTQHARAAGWPLTFSIGVGVFGGESCSTDHAIKMADDLMYRVKSATKNDVLVVDLRRR